MKKQENKHKIDVFNLGKKGACSREQLLEIRRKFIARMETDTCPECCKCHVMLSSVIFVYSEDDCFCTGCFEKTPKLNRHAYVFVDLAIKDPILKNWHLSEELELLHLIHELGVEDTQLLAQSMTIPRSPKTSHHIQELYNKLGASRPLPPVGEEDLEEKNPPFDERQEAWFQLFSDFKERLEEADTDVLDYILGELHDRSDSQLKSFVLKQFQSLTYQRAKMYGMLESLSKKYKERHKHPQIIFSSSSDSLSLSDISKSDPVEFEDFKSQSRMLMQQIDSLLLKHSKGNECEKHRDDGEMKEADVDEGEMKEEVVAVPAIVQKKIKKVTFLEDLIEKIDRYEVKTKRITRNSTKRQKLQLSSQGKPKSKKFQDYLLRKQSRRMKKERKGPSENDD